MRRRSWIVCAIGLCVMAAACSGGNNHASSTSTSRPAATAVAPTAGFLSSAPGDDVHAVSVWSWTGQRVATVRPGTAAKCCQSGGLSPVGTRLLFFDTTRGAALVVDTHGGVLARVAGLDRAAWADDSRHLCYLHPHEVHRNFAHGPADLVLVDPGHGQRVVAQVPGYGSHEAPVIMRCSVIDDYALHFGSTSRGVDSEVIDTASGAVVGRIFGQPQGISWNGHVIVESVNGLILQVIDWRTKVLRWRSPGQPDARPHPVIGVSVSARAHSDDFALTLYDLPGHDPKTAALWLIPSSTPPKLVANAVR